MDEATVQKAINIGIAVRIAKISHVIKPPLSCHAKYPGMKARSVKRKRLLNVSLPGPSAGRGAFLMDAY